MKHTLIIGFGPVGQAIATRLLSRRTITLVQRNRPENLPQGVAFLPCDASDEAALIVAMTGKDEVVVALGLAYDSAVWRRLWPPIMANILTGAQKSGARVVFVDNLYAYGPQDAPLKEDMPLAAVRGKAKVRGEITRQWMAASEGGRVRFIALRAPDFYGAGVENSHFGGISLGAMRRGKPALIIMKPDLPHDIAYVPDIARAVELLLDAPDDVEGKAWHMPCAPTLTPRQFLTVAADVLRQPLRIRVVPVGLLPVLALVSSLMRELDDMRFVLDRPYYVDASRFLARFPFTPTPFEEGLQQSLI